MQKFYGTKHIAAKPMNRLEYNQFRGWELPGDEDGSDEGYLVEYLDGGKPNVQGYAGYVSWSPKEQFEAAYQPTDAMSFGHAIVAMQAGDRVARAGWNGKGMHLKLQTPDAESKMTLPYLYMRTVDGKLVPWLASQTDMLANDWTVVPRASD